MKIPGGYATCPATLLLRGRHGPRFPARPFVASLLTVVFWFLGALSGGQLLALFGLAALGVVSVVLRYRANPGLPNELEK